jgi:hypothetical protein
MDMSAGSASAQISVSYLEVSSDPAAAAADARTVLGLDG